MASQGSRPCIMRAGISSSADLTMMMTAPVLMRRMGWERCWSHDMRNRPSSGLTPHARSHRRDGVCVVPGSVSRWPSWALAWPAWAPPTT